MTPQKRVEAGSCGQSCKSKCFFMHLKELLTIVGLLKFAEVWKIEIIYDVKFSSKPSVCDMAIFNIGRSD